MGKVEIKTEIDLQKLLTQLDTNQLEAFSRELAATIIQRKNSDNKIIQTRLLQQLNEDCSLSEGLNI